MAPKKINLALQGGGAHGAYTWGVLDRLLQEEDVEIEGISGTSAGALNAAMLVHGFMEGGREGARAKLAEFWTKIGDYNALGSFEKWMPQNMPRNWNLDWTGSYSFFDVMSRLYSPYALNPFNLNPLRDVLNEVLDNDQVRACTMIKMFVTATHVQSGQARVFGCDEMSNDVLLASACLPFLFQAVEIEGEAYWDGGYMGNPAIWPLLYHTKSQDVVLVQTNPIRREEVPKQAAEIISRLNEITFNSSLIAEMRAIDFVSRLLHEGLLDSDHYKDVFMHLIYSPDEMKHLNASSKMNVDGSFFEHLKRLGTQAADEWLKKNWRYVGKKPTLNIREKFLEKPLKKRTPRRAKK